MEKGEIRGRLLAMLRPLEGDDNRMPRLAPAPVDRETLHRELTVVAGQSQDPMAGSARLFEESIERLAEEIRQLRGSAVSIAAQPTVVESRGSSLAGDAGRAVLDGLGPAKASFLLAPLLSGIGKLFGGGGDPEPPPPLMPYVPPPSLRVEAGLERSRPGVAQTLRYGQDGLPQVSSMGPITVQVQAIDSRSFLDHSDEIARAVREAMLSAHSLNDVVAEL